MHSCKSSISLRIFLIHYIRFCVMDLKTPVWCLLRALFLYNSKHPCPWSYSSSFKQLCAVYSPHNLWKLKYQSLLIPTTSKCKNQAVCLLFGEAAGENWDYVHTSGYWVVMQESLIFRSQRFMQHSRLTASQDSHMLSVWVAIHLDLELHWLCWSFIRSGCLTFCKLILAD